MRDTCWSYCKVKKVERAISCVLTLIFDTSHCLSWLSFSDSHAGADVVVHVALKFYTIILQLRVWARFFIAAVWGDISRIFSFEYNIEMWILFRCDNVSRSNFVVFYFVFELRRHDGQFKKNLTRADKNNFSFSKMSNIQNNWNCL